MSMTYANANTEARAEDTTFVPRYARTTKSKKSVKTWMILAPIGAVVLLGSGVAMMMGGEQAAPAQPAETAVPAMQTAPAAMTAAQAPVTPAPAEVAPTPAPTPAAAPAPVARRAEPVARRATPAVERPAAARVETPATPSGPQPYTAPAASTSSTSRLNAAPAASTPAPVVTTPAAPAITVQPLN